MNVNRVVANRELRRLATRIAACATLAAPIVTATTASRAGGDPSWATHRDPAGFTVRYPAGWIVETSGTGRIEISADHHRIFALAQPFLLRAGATESASDWLTNEAPRFGKVFSGAQVDTVQPVGASGNSAAAKLTFQTPDGHAAQANLLCGIEGNSGILYAIAAPTAQFAARKATLLQVLESLQFSGPKGAASAHSTGGAVRYTSWKDPREGAFRLDVPQGWKIEGGMFRSGPLDIRPYVQAVSPDGQTMASVGTPGIQIFTNLTPMMAQLGWHEGSIYNVGRGQQEYVLNYRSGADFAEGYVKLVFGQFKGVENLQITGKHDTPLSDGVKKLIAAVYGQNVTSSGGGVYFTYDKDGAPRAGACHVVTLKSAAMGGMWNINGLAVCTSPPAGRDAAIAVATRMVTTFRIDPNWMKTENKVAYATSQDIAREMENFTKNTVRPAENFFAGQVDLVNPSTGEKFRADSGGTTYWRSGGTVVGTSGYSRPGLNFTPLKQW